MAGTNQRIRGRSGRRQNIRDARQRFLIVCEGKQTEPNYFRAGAGRYRHALTRTRRTAD